MQLFEHLSQVGPGWHGLVVRLHETVSALGPYQASEIREKYGSLRVHFDPPVTTQMFELGIAASRASAKLCEFCGDRGRTRGRFDEMRGWLKTCCDDCQPTRVVPPGVQAWKLLDPAGAVVTGPDGLLDTVGTAEQAQADFCDLLRELGHDARTGEDGTIVTGRPAHPDVWTCAGITDGYPGPIRL